MIKLLRRSKPAVELSERLHAEFPQAVADERVPTDSELKLKIKELAEIDGGSDDLKELFDYLKNRPKILTLSQKIIRWAGVGVFIAVLGLTIFIGWWVIYGGTASDSGIIVCRIGIVEHTGDICLEAPKPTETTLPDEGPTQEPDVVVPGSTSR